MDMLDDEGGRGDEYTPEETSTSDEDGSPPSLDEESETEDDDGDDDSIPWVGQAPAASDSVAPGPRRSKRKPAPKVTWWEKEPEVYLASRTKSADASGCDLHKPPANEKEARARPDWPRWKQAIKEEVAAHKNLCTWSKIKVNNKKHKAVKTRFVFDMKNDAEGKMTRYKARFVAQGFNQVPGRDFDETWAPLPYAATTRALFSVAAATGWEVHQVDVKPAFLNAKMDKEMYIKLPDGVDPKGLAGMCRLNLALYGTKQAGRLWGIKLDKQLKEMGAVRPKVDPCLSEWCHPVHGRVFILVYVDDLIVAGEKLEGVKAVKRFVSAKFEVHDMGEVTDFIGMNFMRNRAAKTLTLSNLGHTTTLLEAFGMDKATPNKTPMASGVKLTKTGEGLLPEGNRYAELVGSLLYLSTTTRPDIAFAVGVLSRLMSCRQEDHMRAAKGLLRYLRGTTRLGVVYGGRETLKGFVDANWAGDIDSRLSKTGFVSPSMTGRLRWQASASRPFPPRRPRPSTWPPQWRPRRRCGYASCCRLWASTAGPCRWGRTTSPALRW